MDIILFSTADWDNPFWTNKQHMAVTFEKHSHRVIYVDSLGIRKPRVSKSDFFRIIRRIRTVFKPYKKVSNNIWVVSPLVIPIHSSKLIKKFNDLYLYFVINLLAKYLRFSKYVIWTYSPVTNEIIDKFDSSIKVYHCVDDMSASPYVDKQTIIDCEIDLIEKSDYVFATSIALYDYIKPINKNTFYQNNVCDYEHFSKSKIINYDVPDEIKGMSGPKIIFVGAISSYKIDFDLIKYIANNNKDWNILMIGKVGEGQPGTNISNVEDVNNIHFLGAKSYDKLPEFFQHCDVSIIPCVINDYTSAMFPMKFFEYLSSGLQVVCTSLPALVEYSDLCYISDDFYDFERNVRRVIEGETKSKELIEIACKSHTWDKRYEVMIEQMDGFE